MSHSEPKPDRRSDNWLRLPALVQKTGLPRSTIYRRIAEGTFPPGVKVGPNTTVWFETEVAAFMEGYRRNKSGTASDLRVPKRP